MKALTFKTFVFIAVLFCNPLQSGAWGVLGHRIVGEIADSYLSAKARVEIKKILGHESISMASNWADFIKSDPAYNYLSEWHYIDFDKKYTYAEMQDFLKQDTSTNAHTKLQFLIAELKKKSLQKEKKTMYLRLLIHIVGDIHQPMHTAHTDDKGGNGFKVSWFNKSINLHSLWDSELIEFQQLSYTEYSKAINFTTTSQRVAWQKEPLSKWLFDSNQIAEKLYTDIKPGDNLSYRYNFDHIAPLNQQLLKGGVHLAGLLNKLFDQ